MEPRIFDVVPLEESSIAAPLNVESGPVRFNRNRAEKSDSETNVNEIQLSANLRDKLRALHQWRMDAAQLKIEAEGPHIEGGYAVVCRASLMMAYPKSSTGTADNPDTVIHSQRNVDAAVKMMKIKEGDDIHQILKRAVREADIITDLVHSNIITLEGFVEDVTNRRLWLIFPWAEMGNVRDFVASKDWSIPERINLIYDVACGVEHLHTRNPPICHGDLKSINILVNGESRAIITDFGSARRLRNIHDAKEQEPPPEDVTMAKDMTLLVEFSESSNTMTLTGTKYTLRWVAPEVLKEEDAGTPADIWSMGWVFYEIMTGTIPFESLQNEAAIIRHIVKGEFPSMKDHSRMSPILSLVSLMMMCWEIAPERRPSAERCRKYVSHMSMCKPRLNRSPNTALEAASSLFREGMMYKFQNDYDKALAVFTDGLEKLGDQARSTKEGGNLLWGIAEVHRLRSESADAIALYTEVIQICENIGDRQGKADAQTGLAEAHRARDENDQAAAIYAEVVRIREEIGDRAGKTDAQWGLAEIHRLRDEYDEAAALYTEVIQTCEDIGDRRGKAAAQRGLAKVHLARDEVDKAAALYTEAGQLSEDVGDRSGKASALWGLAYMHLLRHEYDEAVTKFIQVVQMYDDIGDRPGKANAQRGIAEVHRARKQYAESRHVYTESAQLCRGHDDKHGLAYSLRGLADVYSDQKCFEEATKFYEEAAEVFTKIGFAEEASDALERAADTRRKKTELQETDK